MILVEFWSNLVEKYPFKAKKQLYFSETRKRPKPLNYKGFGYFFGISGKWDQQGSNMSEKAA